MSTTPGQERLNAIQMIPEYQEALYLASEKKYSESLAKLHDTISSIEAQAGPNSKFHLYLYRRIASVHMLLGEPEGVEEAYKRCITISESIKTPIIRDVASESQIFFWQEQLIRFYMA